LTKIEQLERAKGMAFLNIMCTQDEVDEVREWIKNNGYVVAFDKTITYPMNIYDGCQNIGARLAPQSN